MDYLTQCMFVTVIKLLYTLMIEKARGKSHAYHLMQAPLDTRKITCHAV